MVDVVGVASEGLPGLTGDLTVRENIKLTSPSGIEFTAKWDGGTRTVRKRLAMYAYANVNGEVVDDYGCNSVTYPISLIFDGDNQRKTAKSFFTAFQESGKWIVVHPTEGPLGLQGVEATEKDDAIKSRNVTRIETQWIEYIDPISLKTLRNALIELGFSFDEFDEAMTLASMSKFQTAIAALKEARESMQSVLSSVKSAYNKAQYFLAAAMDVQAAFVDMITEAQILASGVIAAVKNLITQPARGIQDVKRRIEVANNINAELFAPENSPFEPNLNDMIIKQVAAASSILSIAEAVVTSIEGSVSGLETRADLLGVMDSFDDLIETTFTQLDEMATTSVTAGMPREDQFIPMEGMTTELKNIVAGTRNALRTQFFKLPTSRTIITRRPMSVIQLAKEYYGTTGKVDEILDRIEQANVFTSTQTLLVPAGTRVTIYD